MNSAGGIGTNQAKVLILVFQCHADSCQIIGRGNVFQQEIMLLIGVILVTTGLAARPIDEIDFKFLVDNAVLAGVK